MINLHIKRLYTAEKSLIREIFKKSGSRSIDPNPAFFSNPNNILLIAYAEEVPCGYLYAYILANPVKRKNKMFLYSIDTFPKFRKKGVAKLLIASLKELAIKEDCEGIFLITQKNNTAAVTLYESSEGTRNSDEDLLFKFSLLA